MWGDNCRETVNSLVYPPLFMNDVTFLKGAISFLARTILVHSCYRKKGFSLQRKCVRIIANIGLRHDCREKFK